MVWRGGLFGIIEGMGLIWGLSLVEEEEGY
jgi:hypothetical protein